MNVLGERCIQGITANADRMRDAILGSASIATALSPVLGYEVATALVAEAIATGASIPELLRSSALIDEAVLARVPAPKTSAGQTIPVLVERFRRRRGRPTQRR